MVDGVGTTRYEYNAFGQLAAEDGPWANDTVNYSYDNARRLQQFALDQPGGSRWVQAMTHDAAERVSSISSPAGTFSYDYEPSGARSSVIRKLTLPSGGYITNQFNALMNVTSRVLKNSAGTALNEIGYTYSFLSRPSQMTRGNAITGNYVDYTYDAIGQVKSAKATEGTSGVTVHSLQIAWRKLFWL
jgi:hypothetical protein